MKTLYNQKQFLKEVTGQTIYCICLLAGFATLIVAAYSTDQSPLISDVQNALALLESNT